MLKISKKETLKESIPLIALMSALEVILVIIATYVPFSYLIIIFILMIPSVILGISIKDKYYWLYFVSALSLSLIVSCLDISFSVVFLLPSLIISFLFSLFIKHSLDYTILIFISSVFLFLFEISLIPLIELVLSQDFIKIIFDILKIENNLTNLGIVYGIIYIASFIEVSLSSLIIKEEIKKFEYSFNFNDKYTFILEIILFLCSIITIMSYYFFSFLTVLFLFIAFTIFLLSLFKLLILKKYKRCYILFLIPILYVIYIYNQKFINYSVLISSFYIVYSLFNLIIEIIKLRTNRKTITRNQ